MAKAKMTSEFIHGRAVPICPHCGGQMDEATITLGNMVDVWPMAKHVTVADDGYAYTDERSIIVDCLECLKPSAFAVDGSNFKLVAARTKRDIEFAGLGVAA